MAIRARQWRPESSLNHLSRTRDRGSSAPQEFADRFARVEKLAGQIDRNHCVPLFERNVLERESRWRPVLSARISIVPNSFGIFGEHRLDLTFLADICLKTRSIDLVPLCLYPFHNALRFLRARDVIDHDICSRDTQRERARFANREFAPVTRAY